MPRIARLFIPGLMLHVTARGNDRQDIVRSDEDRDEYLAGARFHADRYGIRIVGYVVMDNHVHFALFAPTKEALSKFMKQLLSEHAVRMNSKYGRSGHLFGDRFYSAPVDDDVAPEVVRYIDLNPVRARMVTRADLFPFSSARAHVLGAVDPLMGALWQPLRAIPDYAAWLAELVPEEEQRLAVVRLCTRRGRRITRALLYGGSPAPDAPK